MPVPSLSLISDALLHLLELRVTDAWKSRYDTSYPVSYSLLPSDKLTGDPTLGFYLYHVIEDPYLKNQPPVSADQPPVRFNPMGLQLFYQLTVNSQRPPDSDLGHMDSVLREQELFGLALKTLHDYPRIDERTTIHITNPPGDKKVFSPGLENTDTVIRISMMNIPADQAGQFWASSKEPIRLAAYYMVTATLLEPEVPSRYAGRVLRYGVQTFVNGAPRLIASHNTVTFVVPNETVTRSITAQPAEAAVTESLQFEGVDLMGDVATTLLIKRSDWDSAGIPGADWSITSGPDTISAKIGTTVTLPSGPKTVTPGHYTATAQVTRNRVMPDGSNKSFVQTSNEIPFTVAPQITTPATGIIATATANVLAIFGGVFPYPIVPPVSKVQVIIGSESVMYEPSDSLTSQGYFKIVSTGELQITFPVPGLIPGKTLPLRIIVNGAESAPRWVTIP